MSHGSAGIQSVNRCSAYKFPQSTNLKRRNQSLQEYRVGQKSIGLGAPLRSAKQTPPWFLDIQDRLGVTHALSECHSNERELEMTATRCSMRDCQRAPTVLLPLPSPLQSSVKGQVIGVFQVGADGTGPPPRSSVARSGSTARGAVRSGGSQRAPSTLKSSAALPKLGQGSGHRRIPGRSRWEALARSVRP